VSDGDAPIVDQVDDYLSQYGFGHRDTPDGYTSSCRHGEDDLIEAQVRRTAHLSR
jgi:hypothetical protein